MNKLRHKYGMADSSYRGAGSEEGIRRLVNDFYDVMESSPEFSVIARMHPNKNLSRDKLARFLCGWLGGPKRYQEKYGPINIPKGARPS